MDTGIAYDIGYAIMIDQEDLADFMRSKEGANP